MSEEHKDEVKNPLFVFKYSVRYIYIEVQYNILIFVFKFLLSSYLYNIRFRPDFVVVISRPNIFVLYTSILN
jgi:hypothetical protein